MQQRRQHINWVKLIKLALFLIVASEAIFLSVCLAFDCRRCIYTHLI